jgi:cytochrome c oxidase assembly factor CtaG
LLWTPSNWRSSLQRSPSTPHMRVTLWISASVALLTTPRTTGRSSDSAILL